MRVRALLISLVGLAVVLRISGQTETVVFLSGDVRLEDGSAPPDAVQINRVCNGRSTLAATTDPTGRFAFSVDATGSSNATADAGQVAADKSEVNRPLGNASQYTNPITSALRGCEVQAVLPGFRTESVRIAVRDTTDDGRLGTIVLHPLSRSGALTISATTAAAPAAAKKAYDTAMQAIGREKWDIAESELTKAVTIYPKFAIAWYQLGQVRQKRNAQDGAMQAWNEARKQDPKYVKPYEILAAVADRQHDWGLAEQYSREWLQLDSEDFAAAYLINAVANANLNHVDAAELAARTGLRVDKERRVPRLNYVLGLLLMGKQQYADSAKYFRAYLELAPNARDAATVREQVAKLDRQAEAGPPH